MTAATLPSARGNHDSDCGDKGFFAYHGAWAPGVRLFRSLRFASKAFIISLAFTLPVLALLIWLLATQTTDAMQARMNATRQVVEVARGIVPLCQDRCRVE